MKPWRLESRRLESQEFRRYVAWDSHGKRFFGTCDEDENEEWLNLHSPGEKREVDLHHVWADPLFAACETFFYLTWSPGLQSTHVYSSTLGLMSAAWSVFDGRKNRPSDRPFRLLLTSWTTVLWNVRADGCTDNVDT